MWPNLRSISWAHFNRLPRSSTLKTTTSNITALTIRNICLRKIIFQADKTRLRIKFLFAWTFHRKDVCSISMKYWRMFYLKYFERNVLSILGFRKITVSCKFFKTVALPMGKFTWLDITWRKISVSKKFLGKSGHFSLKPPRVRRYQIQ